MMTEKQFSGGLYTIPMGYNFLKSLVLGLENLCQNDPLAWIQSEVYLPNHRSVKEFYHILGSTRGFSFLPKVYCLGDLSSHEEVAPASYSDFFHDIFNEGFVDENFEGKSFSDHSSFFAAGSSQKPIIPKLIRKGWMLNLVLLHVKNQKNPPPFFVIFDLVESLLKLLDQGLLDQVDLKKIENFIPENFSQHFQITQNFLKILAQEWPILLEENGYQEFYQSLYARTENLTNSLHEKRKKQGFIVVGGSTGTFKGTALFMKNVSQLDNGYVIFYGPTPNDIAELSHPLAHVHPLNPIKKWISLYGSSFANKLDSDKTLKKNLKLWPFLGPPVSGGALKRKDLFLRKKPPSPSGELPVSFAEGLSMIPCQSIHQEAMIVALIIKKSRAEESSGLIHCITSDHTLSQLIQSHLDQWDIPWLDSQGGSLSTTSIGVFFSFILKILSTGAQPLDFMALLKNSHVGKNMPQNLKKIFLEVAEKNLRKLSIESLKNLFHRVRHQSLNALTVKGLLYPKIFQQALGYFEKKISFLSSKEGFCQSVKQWIHHHTTACLEFSYLFRSVTFKKLCKKSFITDKDDAPHFHWDRTLDYKKNFSEIFKNDCPQIQEEVAVLQSFFKKWADASESFPPITFQEYSFLFNKLLSQERIYDQKKETQVKFLGTLESRLLHSDTTILCGLNEGIWPRSPHQDPWLNYEIREKMGFSPPDYYIGLSAHDFWSAFCQKNVYLTRSTKVMGTITMPSRFWKKVEMIFDFMGVKKSHDNSWIDLYDKLFSQHISYPLQRFFKTSRFEPKEKIFPFRKKNSIMPSPRPPLDARPLFSSVTDLNLWIKNPYHFYIKKILGLRPLNPLQKTFDQQEFGSLVHKILEEILQRSSCLPYDQIFGHQKYSNMYKEIAESFLNFYADSPQYYFWRYRTYSVLQQFYTIELWRKDFVKKSFTEVDGYLYLDLSQKEEDPGKQTSFSGYDLPKKISSGPFFTLFAKADRVDLLEDHSWSIIDYKTGVLPEKSHIVTGESWQMTVETMILLSKNFSIAQLKNSGPQPKINDVSFWAMNGKSQKDIIKDYSGDILNNLPQLENFLKEWIGEFQNAETPYQPKAIPSIFHQEYDLFSRLEDWVA